jgi:hypothetical protein
MQEDGVSQNHSCCLRDDVSTVQMREGFLAPLCAAVITTSISIISTPDPKFESIISTPDPKLEYSVYD